ncbi:MAG: glycosyltransferase, partial [Desulfamplus sp.]|nr:glycosyltransferase [Desulfamplus sp.]
MEYVAVSVIVVNYNGLNHLKKCIPSLINTEGIAFEIIVVDNGSEDESVLWLKKNFEFNKNSLRLKVIEAKKNLGFGRANELGVEFAEGDMIAF